MTEPVEPPEDGIRIRTIAALYAGYKEVFEDPGDGADDWEIREKKNELAWMEALEEDLQAEIAELRAELGVVPEEAQIVELRAVSEADNDQDGKS